MLNTQVSCLSDTIFAWTPGNLNSSVNRDYLKSHLQMEYREANSQHHPASKCRVGLKLGKPPSKTHTRNLFTGVFQLQCHRYLVPDNFVLGHCQVHYTMFHSIPGLNPLSIRTMSQPQDEKRSPDFAIYMLENQVPSS